MPKPPLPPVSPDAPRGSSPLQDTSEAELGQLVDDVLATSTPRAAMGPELGRKQDPRFHADARALAARREAARQAAPPPTSVLQEEPAPSEEWYLALDGKTVGPLTLRTLEAFWDDGTIDPDMLCWREGFAAWLPVRSVEELVQAFTRRPEPLEEAGDAETSGSWKPVAGPVLERLRREQVTPTRPLPPPPLPAPPVDVGEVIRSTVRELTPLMQPAPPAAPAAPRTSLLPVALVSGGISGVLVAVLFLLLRPTTPPAAPLASPAPAAAAPAPPSGAAASPRPQRSPSRGSAAPARRSAPRPAPVAAAAARPPPAPRDALDRALDEPLPGEPLALQDSEVASVVVAHHSEVEACLRQFAPTNPDAPSRLVMRWKVDAEGQASAASAQNVDFQGGPLEGCVARRIAGWRFPAHSEGRDAVLFPFPLNR